MLPFDQPPDLGPLRAKSDVLPLVIARGRTLRRRRRLAFVAPVASLVVAGVVALALIQGSGLGWQQIRTVPASPGGTTPTPRADVTTAQASNQSGEAIRGQDAGTPGATTHSASQHRHSGPPSAAPRTASAPPPGPHRSTVTSVPDAGPCHPAPAGPEGPADRYDCYPTTDGPGGNYTGGGRGCVVHNIGGTIAGQSTTSDFFCSYDAVAPGGYNSNGPFNQLRVTRNGHTILVDGFKAPRCEPTGFIQPGDHIYIDGRNQGSVFPQTSTPYGYTTASVGDRFHC